MSYTERDRVNRLQTAMELVDEAQKIVTEMSGALEVADANSRADVKGAAESVRTRRSAVCELLDRATAALDGVQW